ncbi:hypothetical protein BDF19DRAFT_498315 [Syncephalis fuscata]|nr:hypothetical protein BDF19DRAFT_498315 [Syncephalis fuscata]
MQALIELAKATKVAALITVRDPSQKRRKCDVPLFNISEEDALFIKEGYRNKSGYKYIFAEKYGYIKDGSVTVDTAGPQNEPFMPPFYPDILAPSYKIYTTTIFSQANKPHFSDISAAVAYVAGAVALLIEINDKSLINVKSIKDMLQNSAVPVKDINVDSYAIALYQGAGMLNLNRLIDIDAIRVSPSSINMGDTYANV